MRRKDERAKNIFRIIELAYDSLQSHAEDTYKSKKSHKIKGVGGKEFHRQCIKEYAEIIKLASELY